MKNLITIIFLTIVSFSNLIAQKSSIKLGVGIGNPLFVFGNAPTYRAGYERSVGNRFSISSDLSFLKVKRPYYSIQATQPNSNQNFYDNESLKMVDLGLSYYCFDKAKIFNITLGSGVSVAHSKVGYYPAIVINSGTTTKIIRKNIGNFFTMGKLDIGFRFKILPNLSVSILNTARFANIKIEKHLTPSKGIYDADGRLTSGSYFGNDIKKIQLWSYMSVLTCNYHF